MTAAVLAVVLAGGLGTRMRPLTDRTPKPLLPVGGVPILRIQLEQLRRAGVTDVVLATSYRPSAFDAVLADEDLGLTVVTTVEEEPMGTGGGLAVAASALPPSDAPVVVLNGDLLTGHSLARQVAALKAAGPTVSAVLHVREVPDARPYGSVVEHEGVVTRFVEKSPDPPSRLVNAGTYVLRRDLLTDLVERGGSFSLERDVFPQLVAERRLVAHRDEAYFCDVGNPDALVAASVDVVTRGVPLEDRPTGLHAAIAADALVAPDASVTGGSSLLRGTQVGARSAVVGSIIMDGACVGEGAVLDRSVVGPGAVVPDGAKLVEQVLV